MSFETMQAALEALSRPVLLTRHQRRAAAIMRLSRGMPPKAVAIEVGVHPVTVRKWSAKLREQLERDIHSLLVRRVKDLGGEVRRMKWQNRAHAPDVFVMLPHRHVWVEEKRPGERAGPGQMREHERMRAAGCEVRVIASEADIDYFFPLP